MHINPQYDYNYGPTGPLAALQARSASPQYTYMISPPIGWVDLVVQLNIMLEAIFPDYSIAQVKEKFGGLRYYIESWGEDTDGSKIKMAEFLIKQAEQNSYHICQVCGQPGELRKGNRWWGTFCDEHVGIS